MTTRVQDKLRESNAQMHEKEQERLLEQKDRLEQDSRDLANKLKRAQDKLRINRRINHLFSLHSLI